MSPEQSWPSAMTQAPVRRHVDDLVGLMFVFA
jgi:hypothetical protein